MPILKSEDWFAWAISASADLSGAWFVKSSNYGSTFLLRGKEGRPRNLDGAGRFMNQAELGKAIEIVIGKGGTFPMYESLPAAWRRCARAEAWDSIQVRIAKAILGGESFRWQPWKERRIVYSRENALVPKSRDSDDSWGHYSAGDEEFSEGEIHRHRQWAEDFAEMNGAVFSGG